MPQNFISKNAIKIGLWYVLWKLKILSCVLFSMRSFKIVPTLVITELKTVYMANHLGAEFFTIFWEGKTESEPKKGENKILSHSIVTILVAI